MSSILLHLKNLGTHGRVLGIQIWSVRKRILDNSCISRVGIRYISVDWGNREDRVKPKLRLGPDWIRPLIGIGRVKG